MARTKRADYERRREPCDRRKGATNNEDAIEDFAERVGERSSSGSGEAEPDADPADLQPDDVEGDEPAR